MDRGPWIMLLAFTMAVSLCFMLVALWLILYPATYLSGLYRVQELQVGVCGEPANSGEMFSLGGM
jgi:hypothetical protein